MKTVYITTCREIKGRKYLSKKGHYFTYVAKIKR